MVVIFTFQVKMMPAQMTPQGQVEFLLIVQSVFLSLRTIHIRLALRYVAKTSFQRTTHGSQFPHLET